MFHYNMLKIGLGFFNHAYLLMVRDMAADLQRTTNSATSAFYNSSGL